MNRSLGLDLIRVLAISLVFYSHSIKGVVMGIPIGNFGVELFFVLSGFLVGKHFFTTTNYSLNFAFKFLMKRWLRTLPLYYFVITSKIILTKYTVSDALPFYTFIQNYASSISFFSVSWSLSIEEWFYLLLPLIACLFLRNSSNSSRFIISISVLYILELGLRLFVVLKYDSTWESIGSTIHLRMDSLLTGFLLVFIKYNYSAFFNKLKTLWVFYLSLILIAVYLTFFSFYYQSDQINSILIFRVFGFSVLSILLSLVLPYLELIVLKQDTKFKLIFTALVTLLSTLTYSFYLIHSEVIEVLKTFRVGFTEGILISLTSSLVLSWLLYVAIEKPFLTIKNKIKIH